MSLNLRIFLAFFLIIGVAAYLFLNVLIVELKPGIRQSTEDTLIDMSNLLAELVAEEFAAGEIQQHNFSRSMQLFLQRSYRAKIFSIEKQRSNIRLYITDDRGIVRFDSAAIAVGQDYSRWNDVYLTLQGKYGVRSTRSDPANELSSVMHVAAAIKQDEKIIGVLTIAKPNLSIQPFIELAQTKIKTQGLVLLLLSLIIAMGFSYWLTASIRRLARYSDKVARGEPAEIPQVRETELANLARSIDNMRRQLEGKEYVEKYIHALTHELKSPVSAIKGAAELINPQMQEKDLKHFMSNISYEVSRIDDMINRLLALASVEKREQLEHLDEVDMLKVVNSVIDSKQLQLKSKGLTLDVDFAAIAVIRGDIFMLTQAVDNLLQNSIEFSPQNAVIRIEVKNDSRLAIIISDSGSGIPEYALDKIFERFYSLARPDSNKKSSGLGLCFVQQIMKLHNGTVTIKNKIKNGVIATLEFTKN